MSDLLRTDDGLVDMTQFPDEDIGGFQRRRLHRRLEALDYGVVRDGGWLPISTRFRRGLADSVAAAAGLVPVIGLGVLIAALTTADPVPTASDLEARNPAPAVTVETAIAEAADIDPGQARVDAGHRGVRGSEAAVSGAIGVVDTQLSPPSTAASALRPVAQLAATAKHPPRHVDDCHFIAVIAGRHPVC